MKMTWQEILGGILLLAGLTLIGFFIISPLLPIGTSFRDALVLSFAAGVFLGIPIIRVIVWVWEHDETL